MRVIQIAASYLLSAGSLLLNLGTLTDGEFLKRSGSTVISAALGAGASVLGAPTTVNDMIYSADGSTWVRVTPATLQSILGTATPTASKIPLADSNALLDLWTSGGKGLYGDGSDLVGNISGGTTTLTRDTYYTDLNIAADGILETAGYRVYVNGTLTNAGIIRDNGVNAAADVAGAALASRGTLNTDSGGGGNGRATTGAGSNGTGPVVNVWNGMGTTFAGGAGGAVAGGGAGSGNTPSVRAATAGNIRNWFAAAQGHPCANTGTWQPGGGGGGGGGGGCNVGTGTARSGGGGSGGGAIVIVARRFNNTGTISANGGNGAAASEITGNGTAGGGGGGGGGWVSICAGLVIAEGTVTATGGTGGAGGGGGPSGANGTNGFTQVLRWSA